jgi:hypothetical protein
MQSSVPLTRGTPAAYAPAAPRVAVRSLRTFDGQSQKDDSEIGLRIGKMKTTIASTVRRTRCAPAAYAPVAPRVPVRFAAGEARRSAANFGLTAAAGVISRR